jgi:hypothetical protein
MDQAPKRFSFFPPINSSPVVVVPGVLHYNSWKNVSIGVWVGQATLTAVESLISFGRQIVQLYPGGHSSVVFILDKVAAPTPDAREVFSQFFSARSTLQCNAVILEGSGFWASGLRSMIANTHRSATGSVKLRVGTSVDEVLEWFPEEHARLTGIELDRSELRTELLYSREHGAKEALGEGRG